MVIIFSCTDGKGQLINKTTGELSKTNKRIGKWEYYDEKGKIFAAGSYIDGLKNGLWNYARKTYNGSNSIEWNIVSCDSFKINIPNDWELNIKSNQINPLFFKYNDSSGANGNITLLNEKGDNSIASIATKLINQNKTITDYKLLMRKNVEINEIKSVYIQQVLKVNNQELLVEQFIVQDSPENYYLLSFFVKKSKIKLYHQLFSEIAYSFSFLKVNN